MLHRRGLHGVVAAVCFSVVTGAVSAGNTTADGLARLRAKYPGVRAVSTGEGERAVFGRPMGQAASAAKAAATWIAEHLDALGDRRSELRETNRHDLGGGRLTAFAYRQYLAGLPVEDGIVRVAVERGRRHAVVYVGGRLARLPDTGLTPVRTSEREVVEAVRGLPGYAGLNDFQPATLAIFVPQGDFSTQTPVRVWKFVGSGGDRGNFSAFTFFVDATTGVLIHARDEVYQAEISGHVQGNATPGVLPDGPSNPALPVDLALLTVRNATQGNDSETDESGSFTLGHVGLGTANVTAALEGPFAVVNPMQGTALTVSQVVISPGPADFLFNPTPTEFSTAQVNGFVHTNLAHEFFKSRQPDFTALDIPLDCNVNLPNFCNASFTPIGPSLNFFASGGGCVNTAYGSVIHHEFGHFIVSEHGLSQGAFGEGYGDTLAILINDDPVVGRDFQGVGSPVRDIVAANKQYPCFGEIHDCGQILGGVWWDLRLNLGETLGAAGLDYARQLFTDWTGITVGGRGRSSAHPVTAVEVLTADDDDGDLTNGTPNQAEICEAFAAHSIPCPGGCESISSLRLTCRAGTFTIRASITSDSAAGSEFTLNLDESQSDTVTLSRFGRASARFSGVSEGSHTVCVEGCAEVCGTVGCGP